MSTTDDDLVPAPPDALQLPRPVLTWRAPPSRGVVWSSRPDELETDDTDMTRVEPSTAPIDDEPTMAIQIPVLPGAPERGSALERVLAHLNATLPRAAKLWREHPLRAAAVLGGAAVIIYLALGCVRHGSHDRTQILLTPAAAPPAAPQIIVEQLTDVTRPPETEEAPLHGKQSDKPSRKMAPAQLQPTPSEAEPSSTAASTSSPGLPAWGAEALRHFASGNGSPGASVTSQPQPASSNADVPPPAVGFKAGARAQPEATAVVAGTFLELPELAPPPVSSEPLTMDQLLKQVEAVGQAQRTQPGPKAPKTSKRDAELDELINGAMTSKTQ